MMLRVGLFLEHNPGLTFLDGLEGLESLPWLYIYESPVRQGGSKACVAIAVFLGGTNAPLYGRSVIWTHHNPAVSRKSEARILQRIALLLGL